MMVRRMRFLFNHASLGVITASAGVLLRAGRRAGGICYGFPFAECMIRLGVIRVEGTASIAFFPVLCIVMLADESMVGRCTVFSLADFTSGFLGAGSMSAAVGFLVKRLTAGRADMPVIRIIAVPAGCVGCMAGGRNHDAVVVGDFILAAFIQEPCAASGAGPVFRVACFGAGSGFRVSLGQGVVGHGERHIGNLGCAGCIRELLAASAAFPIFNAASSGAGGSYSFVMRQGVRDHRNLCSFGIAAVRAGALLCAGFRAGSFLFGDPFAKVVIRFRICRVDGTASTAFFPVLRSIVIPLIVMLSGRTVFLTAGFTSGLRGAGSGSAAVRSLVQHCIASRADMPVIVAVIAPCFGRRVTGCFLYNRIFIRDLGRAVLIREPLFAGGAGPIRRVAIFRAGCVLCRNSSQRVADRDLRRSNDRCDIFKCRNCRAFLEEFTENRNTLRFCVTFQNLKRQCKQDTFIGGHIKLFRCTCICSVYCAAVCFSAVFINNGIHIEGGFYRKVRNCKFRTVKVDFMTCIDSFQLKLRQVKIEI